MVIDDLEVSSNFDSWDDEEVEEEIETCPFGFNPLEFGECCECIYRLGAETCEFRCPFGTIPLCGEGCELNKEKGGT